MLKTLRGTAASLLGLAAHPEQRRGCATRAFDHGINYFFFYGPGHASFVRELAPLARKRRDEIIVATGSGARKRAGLTGARRKIFTALGLDMVDVFFAEYIHPQDDPNAIFGDGGVLDELQRWKTDGYVRYIGASAHDRKLAKRLAADPRVDLLMHRFNMAHRKAVREVFPTAVQTQTPVVAFTATRWGTLLKPHKQWAGGPPTAADCYRYCLAHPAVRLVLTAPKSITELEENLEVLRAAPMSDTDRLYWERFGDLVYGRGTDGFERQWP